MPLQTNFGTSTYVDPAKNLREALMQGVVIIKDLRDAEIQAKKDKLVLDKERAGMEFAEGTLTHEGKTWMPTGDLLNRGALDITNKMEFKDTDTPEVRAEKERLQQGLSDWYDTQGQKMYESEKMADILAQRKKSGAIVTPEMYAAMAGAKKAEIDIRQKKSEAESKAAETSSKARDEYLLEAAKMDAKTFDKGITSKSSKEGGYNKPITYDAAMKKREAVKKDVGTWMSENIGVGGIELFFDEALKNKLTEAEVDSIIGAVTERGAFDDTFDAKKAKAYIQKAVKNPKIATKDYTSNPNSAVAKELAVSAATQAQQAKTKALGYLTEPEDARKTIAKTNFDKYMSELLSKTSNTTKDSDKVNTDTKQNIKQNDKDTKTTKTTKKVLDVGGLNKDGTLNKDARNAINEALKGIGGRLPDVKLKPEEADAVVNNLIKDREIRKNSDNTMSTGIMTPEARTARGATIVNAIKQPGIFSDLRIDTPSGKQIAKMFGMNTDTEAVNMQRKPIPRSEMLKLTDEDITKLLQRSDLTNSERRLAGNIYGSPRKPATSQNVDRAAFDIVNNNSITPTVKYTQLVALGVPIATAQQLAFSK